MGETPSAGTPAPDTSGRLPAQARAALTMLLARGSLLARTKPDLYDAAVANLTGIQAVLADLDLELQPELTIGLLAVRPRVLQGEEGEEEGEGDSRLIRARKLSLYDSLAVIVLRRHWRSRTHAGDTRVTMDLAHLAEALQPFLPLTQSESRDRRKLSGCIDRLKEMNLVAAVRGDDQRIEVTPVLPIMIDGPLADQLHEQYSKLAGEAPLPTENSV